MTRNLDKMLKALVDSKQYDNIQILLRINGISHGGIFLPYHKLQSLRLSYVAELLEDYLIQRPHLIRDELLVVSLSRLVNTGTPEQIRGLLRIPGIPIYELVRIWADEYMLSNFANVKPIQDYIETLSRPTSPDITSIVKLLFHSLVKRGSIHDIQNLGSFYGFTKEMFVQELLGLGRKWILKRDKMVTIFTIGIRRFPEFKNEVCALTKNENSSLRFLCTN
jgi:hypothetical protein